MGGRAAVGDVRRGWSESMRRIHGKNGNDKKGNRKKGNEKKRQRKIGLPENWATVKFGNEK